MTCFTSCPPCPGCEELRRRAEAAERALAEQGSIVEWVQHAVRGEPVSEFAEGFGVVAAVVELRETVAAHEATIAIACQRTYELEQTLRAQTALALERLERIGRLEGALREMLRASPDESRANRSSYIEHGMLCSHERQIGPCDCGHTEWLAACTAARAALSDASPETKDKDR